MFALIFLVAGVGVACFGTGLLTGDNRHRYKISHCSACKEVKRCPQCSERAKTYDPKTSGPKGIEKRGAATPETFAGIKTPWKTA